MLQLRSPLAWTAMAGFTLALGACASASQQDLGFRVQEPTPSQFASECGDRSGGEIEAIRSRLVDGFVMPPRGADLCEVMIHLGLPLELKIVRRSEWPVQLTYGYFDGPPISNRRPTLMVYMVVEDRPDVIEAPRRNPTRILAKLDRIEWLEQR